MKRRTFLELTGWGATGLSLTGLSLQPLREAGRLLQPMYSVAQMVGEVTPTSALLQTRLSRQAALPDDPLDSAAAIVGQDIVGCPGVARFEISGNARFEEARNTPWKRAEPDRDFIVKHKVEGLSPGVRHYMRVRFGPSEDQTYTGPVSQFKTLPPEEAEEPLSFVVSSCMCLGHFLLGRGEEAWERPAQGRDRTLGYPALEAIEHLQPAFWVQTGDDVYYDHPKEEKAKTRKQLRAKWHRQMALPRMQGLLQHASVYWMKDDHDFRYNDSDAQQRGDGPSPELGIATFREQVPVVDPEASEARTYRTRRVGRLLQIWMLEGRDYRDPNTMPDGPDKSIWGEEQLQWLQQTLLASEAVFKLLIVPSPLVGPDDAYKHDNHVNYGGFQHERDQFFGWLNAHDFQRKNFYIVTGDRHWQYHSIHPAGFEEFGTGTLTTSHARLGREPGDPDSTDPLGLITQPYIQQQPTGGFLSVQVQPPEEGRPARLIFATQDERGHLLNSETKRALQ